MRRSSRRSKRKPTEANNMATINTEDLFWAVGNFKRTVKRIDDGAAICDDIIRMVTERADIEAKYAKKLTVWEDKWQKQVENSQLYATSKNAFIGVISEAQERAKIHMDCYGRLHNQVIESMKRWKNQTYHKHFMGYWKETREVDDEFTRAQKPWAEGFAKVQRAKRNYHSACKAFETASQTLSSANNDENYAPEKIKKLEDSANKQENNVARTKKKYQEKLQRIEPLNTSYEVEMIKVFDKCQQMEEKKLNFFQDMMMEYHKSLNISEDTRLSEMFRAQIESAYSANVKHDLTWWAETYGADMPRNWPKFEEPGESSTQLIPEKNSYENNAQSEPEYQIPKQHESNPPPIVPYMGEDNPFAVDNGENRSDDEWEDPPPEDPSIGVPVRALYTYNAVEDDELSFKSGDILSKLSEEDAQGWCKGRFNGKEGLYPANYVELI